MRGKPGYEHLNEPLHILVEAELPAEIIDARLMQARDILEDLLKPMVCSNMRFTTVALLLCISLAGTFVEQLLQYKFSRKPNIFQLNSLNSFSLWVKVKLLLGFQS